MASRLPHVRSRVRLNVSQEYASEEVEDSEDLYSVSPEQKARRSAALVSSSSAVFKTAKGKLAKGKLAKVRDHGGAAAALRKKRNEARKECASRIDKTVDKYGNAVANAVRITPCTIVKETTGKVPTSTEKSVTTTASVGNVAANVSEVLAGFGTKRNAPVGKSEPALCNNGSPSALRQDAGLEVERSLRRTLDTVQVQSDSLPGVEQKASQHRSARSKPGAWLKRSPVQDTTVTEVISIHSDPESRLEAVGGVQECAPEPENVNQATNLQGIQGVSCTARPSGMSTLDDIGKSSFSIGKNPEQDVAAPRKTRGQTAATKRRFQISQAEFEPISSVTESEANRTRKRRAPGKKAAPKKTRVYADQVSRRMPAPAESPITNADAEPDITQTNESRVQEQRLEEISNACEQQPAFRADVRDNPGDAKCNEQPGSEGSQSPPSKASVQVSGSTQNQATAELPRETDTAQPTRCNANIAISASSPDLREPESGSKTTPEAETARKLGEPLRVVKAPKKPCTTSIARRSDARVPGPLAKSNLQARHAPARRTKSSARLTLEGSQTVDVNGSPVPIDLNVPQRSTVLEAFSRRAPRSRPWSERRRNLPSSVLSKEKEDGVLAHPEDSTDTTSSGDFEDELARELDTRLPSRPTNSPSPHPPSNHDRASTFPEPLSDDLLSWRSTLRPHQLDLFDQLVRSARRLTALVAEQEAGGLRLLREHHRLGLARISRDELLRAEEYEALRQDLARRRRARKRELRALQRDLDASIAEWESAKTERDEGRTQREKLGREVEELIERLS